MGKILNLIKSVGRNIENYAYGLEKKKKSGFEWRAAMGLDAINQMEEFCIYKPWGAIFHTLRVQLFRFAALALISFDLFVWFCVPVWAMVIYEYYLALKWLGKYNISAVKILVLTAFFELLIFLLAPYARRFIWFLVAGEWVV